jgi:hypothetical protein
MQRANLKRQPLIRSHAFENGQLLSDSILGFRSFSVEFSAKESMSSKPRFPFQPPEPDIVIEPDSYDDV